MHYLTVDGMLSGTGIRDNVQGGYIAPVSLGLSAALVERIAQWLAQYEDAHFRQYPSEAEVDDLDVEGQTIARLVNEELPSSKVEYFSGATMSKQAI